MPRSRFYASTQEGRCVDPQRLDWAVTLATQNPQRIRIAQISADTSQRAVLAPASNLTKDQS